MYWQLLPRLVDSSFDPPCADANRRLRNTEFEPPTQYAPTTTPTTQQRHTHNRVLRHCFATCIMSFSLSHTMVGHGTALRPLDEARPGELEGERWGSDDDWDNQGPETCLLPLPASSLWGR